MNDDIKKERRERLKKAHPDKGGSEEEFHEVMKEYEILEKQLVDRTKLKKYSGNTYVENINEKTWVQLFENTSKLCSEFQNEITKNRKFYESIMSTSDLQEMLDNINEILLNIDIVLKCYKTANKLPEGLAEEVKQDLYREANPMYIIIKNYEQYHLKFKKLQKLRIQETSDSDESDKIEFGEDAKSFDSELERRKKQVEEDYYAEKRAERENRDP